MSSITTVDMSTNWSQLGSRSNTPVQVKTLLAVDTSPLRDGIEPDSCIKMRQNWAALQVGVREAILATDPIRSFPLYWAKTEDGVVISDSCFVLAQETGARPNRKALDYMRFTGFCPGEETFFEGIS